MKCGQNLMLKASLFARIQFEFKSLFNAQPLLEKKSERTHRKALHRADPRLEFVSVKARRNCQIESFFLVRFWGKLARAQRPQFTQMRRISQKRRRCPGLFLQ